MTKEEAELIAIKIHNECRSHKGCNGCPFYYIKDCEEYCAVDMMPQGTSW